MRLIEKTEKALADFAEQSEATVMILRSHDEELAPVVRCLEGIDGMPHFVYIDITPVVGDLTDYVDMIIATLLEQMEVISAEEGASPEAGPRTGEPPEACWSREVDPLLRLRLAFAHLATWLPAGDETHLVVALLPNTIPHPAVHARVVGALLPQAGFEPWMARVRFIVRDDKSSSFLSKSAFDARAPGVVVFETQLAAPDILDELIEDGANPELLPGQRIQALLQCAMMEVSLGMLPEAMAKLSRLYGYYTAYQIPQMQGVVLLQVAEAFRKANAPARARNALMAALDTGTANNDIPLLVNASHALAFQGAARGDHAEVEMACAVGAEGAKLLGMDDMRAEFLLRRGDARAALGNWGGAIAIWTECANETREKGNYNMLLGALGRLHDYASRAGHRDIASGYAHEIREHQAIVEAGSPR